MTKTPEAETYNLPKSMGTLRNQPKEGYSNSLAGNFYENLWNSIRQATGDIYILGAGPAHEEVGLAFPGTSTLKDSTSNIHCIDIRDDVPEEVVALQNRGLQINYQTNTELTTWNPEPQTNVDLVTMHGMLDYITPPEIAKLLTKVTTKLSPQKITLRSDTHNHPAMQDVFIPNTQNPETLKALKKAAETEQQQIEALSQSLKNQHEVPSLSDQEFIQAIEEITVQIPSEALAKHNLDTQFPSSHIPPYALAQFMIGKGYQVNDFKAFSIMQPNQPFNIVISFSKLNTPN
jgi:hypothetical protein